jgi:ADP-ribosylglycohydrolase
MYGENGVGPRYTYCRNTYRDWLITQGKLPKPKDEVDLFTWLMRVPVLFSRRAPGLTCLDFDFNNPGSIENPTNDSKGCGGVMRVAPVGLIYPAFFEISENEGAKVVLEGAQCAALTHGGELGYIPAGCLAQIINLASHTDKKIKDIIEKALRDTAEMFSEKSDFPYFQKIITKAIVLSKSKMNDEQCIHEIGEGWVAEEALAIAIYCALRHSNDFAAAIRAAVNHDGDSDSTGSIVGNILGAYLGASAIPDFYKKNLELVDVIYELALDLAIGRFAKYMPSNYENKDEFELKYISSK